MFVEHLSERESFEATRIVGVMSVEFGVSFPTRDKDILRINNDNLIILHFIKLEIRSVFALKHSGYFLAHSSQRLKEN